MNSKIKWWLNGIGAIILVIIAVLYLIIRPIAVQNLEPVIIQAAEEKINGKLSWRMMDLDPKYNLSFDYLSLKDENDRDVLKSSNITVDWSASALWDYYMNNGALLNVVRSITIEEPEIWIQEKPNGEWNIQNIIRDNTEETKGEFKGNVLIDKGKATINLLSGETYEFDKLSGDFRWQEDKKIKGRFNGTFLDNGFDGTLLYTDENNLEGEIKAESIDLKSLKPLIQKMPDTWHLSDVKSGSGEVTSAKVWRSDGVLSYHIEGRLKQTALSYENYALTDGTAFFDIYNKNIAVKNFSGKINGQSIDGNIEIDMSETDPALMGEVKLHHVTAEKVLPDAGVTGEIDGTARIGGTVSNLLINGAFSVKDGNYNNFQVKDGKFLLSYEGNDVYIHSLEAHAGGGFISGQGRYNMENGEFNIAAEVEDFALEQVPTSDQMMGLITGTIVAQGRYSNDGLSLTQASIEGKGENILYNDNAAGIISGTAQYDNEGWTAVFAADAVSAAGIQANSMAGKVNGNSHGYDISYLNGKIGDGVVSLKGTYGEEFIDLVVNAVDIDISQLSEPAGIDMSGTASLDLSITGTAENPAARGTIFARNGYFGPVDFDTAEGKFNYADQSVSLDSVTIKKDDGTHVINGFVAMNKEHDLDLNIKSEKIRIENLLAMGNLSYPVTGWIENTLHVKGNLNTPEVTGDFLAWDGSVSGQLFQSASGRYMLGKDRIVIKDGLVYIYDGVASVEGTVDNNNLDFDVLLADIEIDRLLSDKGIHGKATLKGHVSGTVDDPIFQGSAQSREISVADGQIWMLSTGIDYRNHVLSVSDGSFQQGDGTFTWKGLYNNQSGILSGNLEFKNWDINEIVKLFGLPVHNVGGVVRGDMTIKGTLDNPDVSFRAKINGGHLADTSIGEGDIDFSYAGKALSIRKLYIPVGKGILAAQGGMSVNGDLDLQVAANDMDISWIPQVMGDGSVYLGGNLTAAAHLLGTKENPQIDFSVGIENPKYNDYSFDSLSFMGVTENDTIHISQALVRKEPYKVSAKGYMPVSMLTRNDIGNSSPLNLEINLDNADLNALTLFFKPINSAKGLIEGQIKVSGDWKDPEIYGHVGVKNSQMTVATLSDPIMPVDGDISFNGHSATVKGKAIFDKGEASVDGAVNWNNSVITGYTGEAHIHNPNINSTYYKGALDADFTLGEIMGMPGFEGTMHIHDATVDIPLDLLSDEETGMIPAAMKMEIILGDNVRLYNRSLYDIWLRGNIDATGPVLSPAVSGKVNVEKGTVKVNMTEFKIDSGSAVWGGEEGGILPTIRVRASAKVSDYNIWAELDGVPGNMTTVFRSEPYLNDSQILMLLTLHSNPNGENQGAMEGALFNAGLTLVFGNGVQDFFQDTIGLDLISITSSLTDYYDSDSSNNNYYYIKIGKYLFNDFMLTATTGVNNKQQSVGFHYDINSHIGLSAWYNNEHNSYIGTDWKFRF